jgi:hypothetical protein
MFFSGKICVLFDDIEFAGLRGFEGGVMCFILPLDDIFMADFPNGLRV